jgi:hypothetical protein
MSLIPLIDPASCSSILRRKCLLLIHIKPFSIEEVMGHHLEEAVTLPLLINAIPTETVVQILPPLTTATVNTIGTNKVTLP